MYFFIVVTGILVMILSFGMLKNEYDKRKEYYAEIFDSSLWVPFEDGEYGCHDFTSTHYILGRYKRKCDIHLGNSDKRIGREHAMIWYEDGQFYVKPVGSGHTVCVNNKIVPDEGVALEHNDKIQIECLVMYFTKRGERYEQY